MPEVNLLAGGLRNSQGFEHQTDYQENVSLNDALTENLAVGGGFNHVSIGGRPGWAIGPQLTYEIGM